jgi:hypothetical protein
MDLLMVTVPAAAYTAKVEPHHAKVNLCEICDVRGSSDNTGS